MKTPTGLPTKYRVFQQRFSLVIGVLTVALASSFAQAEAVDIDMPAAALSSGWQVIEHDNGQAVEVTRRSAGGSVSTVCAGGQCNVFVEPLSTCTPSAEYPILLNSTNQVGVIPGVCRIIADEHGSRQVVHLKDRQAVFAAMLKGDDLSLAFPTAHGAVEVIEVVMEGLRPLLNEAIARHGAKGAETVDQPPALIDWVIQQTETRDVI